MVIYIYFDDNGNFQIFFKRFYSAIFIECGDIIFNKRNYYELFVYIFIKYLGWYYGVIKRLYNE